MSRTAPPRRSRKATRWLLVALLLLLLGVLLAPGGLYDAYAGGGGGSPVTSETDSFTIGSNVIEPMWLGQRVPVNLIFTNLESTTVTATHLQVAILEVDALRADTTHPCRPADFAVRQPAGDLVVTIPPNGRTTLEALGEPKSDWPSITLLDLPTNQDGCQGASVILSYTAEGPPQ